MKNFDKFIWSLLGFSLAMVVSSPKAKELYAKTLAGLGAEKTFDYPSMVQSIIFPKDKYNMLSASRWLKQHGYAHAKLDEGGPAATYYRFRQFDPSNFEAKKFKTISFGSSGIKAIIGDARNQEVWSRMRSERYARQSQMRDKRIIKVAA